MILYKLALKQISKCYQTDKYALNNINLEINKKEFLVIVGPSGCGKTTLLRIISGLEKPTSGDIYIDDYYVNNNSPKDRNVAMVFQDYPLYPNLTVFQNIAFSLKNMKLDIDEIEEKINKVADILDIYSLLNRKPKHLSGGQKQKVSLAKSMIREPRFLLFDEPLANIDPSQRNELRLEIMKLYELLDITFIYVTHDQNEALSLGTKILVMNQGEIEQIGSPKMIFENPNNFFVASFFSSPKLNLISGKIVKEEVIKLIYGDHRQYKLSLPNESTQMVESYIDKEIIFGIRSECIESGDSYQVQGEITHIEYLGNTYAYHLKIDGLQDNLVMKSQMDNLYPVGQLLTIGFDIDDIFLFDKDNEKTIFLYPQTNVIEGIYQNGCFQMGYQSIHFSERFTKTVLKSALNRTLFLNIPVSPQNNSPSDGQIRINITVNKTKKLRKGYLVYGTVTGTNNRVIIQSSNEYKLSDHIILYAHEEEIILQDHTANRLNSKRIISNNRTTVKITTDNLKTYVHLGKSKIEIDYVNIQDGFYQVELSQETIEVIAKKTTFQEIKKEYQLHKNNNIVIGSAYDEDVIGNKNILFLKIDGFQEYVTIIVNNDFTVYDYPEVLLSIPKGAITIIDMNR